MFVYSAVEAYKAYLELGGELYQKGGKKVTVEGIADYLQRMSPMASTFKEKALSDDEIIRAIREEIRIEYLIKEEGEHAKKHEAESAKGEAL